MGIFIPVLLMRKCKQRGIYGQGTKSRGWKLASWESQIQVFGLPSPYSFFLASLLLTLDARVGNSSHKTLWTVPETLYGAINIS